ncbi:hypothetical protein T03_11159 [Trichinella britovi]|uniref:Uncharacterized protein n=1 Tax=Trichinella britovi TaxID=45882 RepID=A0A0V1CDY8_TRIBR|nr:hypothetical protein T03_11159 [Trichinella britovi]
MVVKITVNIMKSRQSTCLPRISCKFLFECYALACVALIAMVVAVHYAADRGRHEAYRGRHEADRGRHEADRGRHEADRGRHEAVQEKTKFLGPQFCSCFTCLRCAGSLVLFPAPRGGEIVRFLPAQQSGGDFAFFLVLIP